MDALSIWDSFSRFAPDDDDTVSTGLGKGVGSGEIEVVI